MGKYKITICCLLLVCLLSGCGAGDIPNPSSGSGNLPESTVINQENYQNDLDGLVNFMKDSGFVSGDGTDMSSRMIGSIRGVKFQFKKGKSNVTAEFYDYGNTENSDGAKVVDEIRQTGVLKILDKEIPASVSKNGRYVMIYTGLSEDDGDIEKIKEIFENFDFR